MCIPNNNFFVSVNGKREYRNLTRKEAIALAIKEHEKYPELGTIQIGIGRTKIKDGVKMYSMLPYDYFL